MNKNQFAKTPPMGWNSYDYYDTTVNEERVKANADYMAARLKSFGWEYIVVDIQWYAKGAGSQRKEYQYIPFDQLEMDDHSRLQPDPIRFPSSVGGRGFGPLAEYVHGLGLKFGIHIMRGIPRKAAQAHLPILGTSETADRIADPFSICPWNPDMYGVRPTPAGQAYYNSLIDLYAQWGVDFIKCDDICDSRMYRGEDFSGWEETRMIHRAIKQCGRPMVLSLSPGPAHIDRAWEYGRYANMWRITDDFWDRWELLKAMFERCEKWQAHVKTGCYPDCDMLALGQLGKGFGQERKTNFTREEQKTMMTLWCMFRSPLMIGAELTMLDDWTVSLLTNREVLELLKDTRRGIQIMRTEHMAVWKNQDISDKTLCVAFFNLKDVDAVLSVPVDELTGEESPADAGRTWTELWDGSRIEPEHGLLQTEVPAHGVKVYKARPFPGIRQSGAV